MSMSIKPGNIVEIIIDSLSARGFRGTPLKAHVYDVTETQLILSQTSPAIVTPGTKRPAYISYIITQEGSTRRLGFSAMISEFDGQYQLASGSPVPALIAEMTTKPKEASLRRGFRVRPPRESAISLTIGERELAILDISVSGLRFIQLLSDVPFKPAQMLPCLLRVDGQLYPLTARVIRVTNTRISRHVAAVFVETDKGLDPVLARKILMLEREELSRKGLLDPYQK
jgi:hypothetical protein